MEIWIKHTNLIDFPYTPGKNGADGLFSFDEQKVNNLVSEIMFAPPTCYLVSGYRGAGKTSFIRRVQEGCNDQAKSKEKEYKKVVFVYSSFPNFESKTYFLRKLIRDFREAVTGWESKSENLFDSDLNNLYIKTFNEIKSERSRAMETEKSVEFSLETKDFFKKLFVGLAPFFAPFIAEVVFNPFFNMVHWVTFPILKSFVYLGSIAWGIANAIKITLKYNIKQSYTEKVTATSLSDDDITEYDLEHVLETFNKQNYKIVFVLDELDKIEDGELDQLLREMKPWLVKGKADFILVAGQRLTMRYYNLKDRDDELLSSLFSKIIHISPMTEQQLFRIYRDLLIQGMTGYDQKPTAIPLEAFNEEDAALANALGNNLIYRSRRIPRTFMNLIRQELQWREGKAFLPVPNSNFRFHEIKMRILRNLFENLLLYAQVSETARSHIIMQLFRASSIIRSEGPVEMSLTTMQEYVFNPANSPEKEIYPYPDLYPVLLSCLSEFYQQAVKEKIVLRPTLKEPVDQDDPDFGEQIEEAHTGKRLNDSEDDVAFKIFVSDFDTFIQILVGMVKELLQNYKGDPVKATVDELLAAYADAGILEMPVNNSIIFKHPISVYKERINQPQIFKSVFDHFVSNNLSFKGLFQQLLRGFTERKLAEVFKQISSYFKDGKSNQTGTADYRATIPTKLGAIDLLIDFSYVEGEVNIPEEEIGRSIALLDDFNIRSQKGNYYVSIIFFRQNRGWDETALSTSASYQIEKIRPDLGERINYIILSIFNYGSLRNQLEQIMAGARSYSLLPIFDEKKAEKLRRSGHGEGANSKLRDTQKGKWGESSNSGDRTVSASVHATEQTELFSVNVEVKSLSKYKPLAGKVTFHLHAVFTPEKFTTFAVDGVAKLSGLRCAGPFTIGVSCDNDTTRLELDLHDIPNAPPEFKPIFVS